MMEVEAKTRAFVVFLGCTGRLSRGSEITVGCLAQDQRD